MAPPTVPTLSSICTEGLKKAGFATTSSQWSALLSRAQTEWIEEAKNEIWTRHKKLKSLQTIGIVTTTIGRARYSFPTDFSSPVGKVIEVLYGSTTGSAQAGASSSITLAAGFSDTESNIQGKEIAIISGTGINQISQITAYDNATKIATVSPAWTTIPAAASGYMIIDTYKSATENPIWEYGFNFNPNQKSAPLNYYPMGDADDGEFMLSPTPDKVYSLRIRYYADLMELDLTSTTLATLYKNWRNVLVQAVYAKALQSLDDTRYVGEMQTFYNLLNIAMGHEVYTSDLSNLQMKISED